MGIVGYFLFVIVDDTDQTQFLANTDLLLILFSS